MTVPDMAGAVTIPVAPLPPAPPSTGGNGSVRTFTQDEVNELLNGARAQEKDKLYNRLQKVEELEVRFNTVQAEREAAEKARTEAEAAVQATEEKALREKAEAEMSAKQFAEERHTELLSQLEALREETARKDAIFAREREFNDLQAYRREVLEASAEEIAPELLDLVAGSTRDEVDASIELMKGKTAQLVENMLAAQAGVTPPRPVSPTGRPNVDPFGGDATKTYSAQDLKDMSMADYVANRTQLLGAASAQYRQGLGNR